LRDEADGSDRRDGAHLADHDAEPQASVDRGIAAPLLALAEKFEARAGLIRELRNRAVKANDHDAILTRSAALRTWNEAAQIPRDYASRHPAPRVEAMKEAE